MKKAIIIGITGQDGAYLAEHLLNNNYEVFGTYRHNISFWRLNYLRITKNSNLKLVEFDLTDQCATIRLLDKIQPDEVYNLATQNFVGISFDQPHTTTQIVALGTLNILEAIRTVNKNIRFYQDSTSQMFGKAQSIPQNELTPFHPRSPYGIAKLYAHWMTINYHESYNIFASSGILFNHESPLSNKECVTRKITNGLARIKRGMLDTIELGNLDAKRDWGYAKDYVSGIHLMLQADNPDTFVLATNRSETVREFINMACQAANIELQWHGSGSAEIGVDATTGKTLIAVNPKFYRPTEVDLLMGDYDKARRILGWQPDTSLESLCEMMVDADIERLENESGQ